MKGVSEVKNADVIKHSEEFKPTIVATFCWFLVSYFILFLRWGYTFGGGDQVEILPYALKIVDPELFTNDLFIQHISGTPVNQRWAIAHLLSWFGESMPYAAFLLFSICLFFLVRVILLLASHFKLSAYSAFVGTVVLLWLTNGWSPGGNDLYSNCFTADSVSIPLCLFGLYYGFQDKWITAGLALGVASLFQPLMGFQMACLIALNVLVRTRNRSALLKLVLTYLVFGGWLFLALALSFFGGEEVMMDNSFDVYFKMRAPHHFIPSYFITWNSIVFFALLLGVAWYQTKRDVQVATILCIIGLGAVVYAIGVQFFDSQILASTQWFKTMQWAKVLMVLSMLFGVDGVIRKMQELLPTSLPMIGAIVSSILLVFLFMFPQYHPLNKSNDLVQQQPNEELYEFVQSQTHKNACFIIPIDNTDFKFGAERSVFVDYKSIDPKPAFVLEWQKRIEDVYGTMSANLTGFEFYIPASKHYEALTRSDLVYLKNLGVSHALFYHPKEIDGLQLIYQDHKNYVYELVN